MTDLTALSDDELLKLHQEVQANPLASMSDDELNKLHAQSQPKPFGLSDTWPARLARGVYDSVASGVTLPADVMAGRARLPSSGAVPGSVEFGDPQSAGLRVADLAGLANPINPMVRSGDRAVAGVATNLKREVPTSEALRGAADAGYKAAGEMGVDIAAKPVQSLGHTIQAGLEKDGVFAELAPKTFSILSKLQNAPDGAIVTVANLDTARKALGHAAGDFTNKTEQLAASRAIKGLDEYLANAPAQDILAGDAAAAADALGQARGNYAAAMRSDSITGKEYRAELNADVANSGQNTGNQLRQRMRDVLVRPKEARGFSDEELAQAERIARGTVPMNTARYIGNLLGGGGGLGQAATAGMGAAVGGAAGGGLGAAVGAAAPVAVGSMAKSLANALTSHQVGKLDEMVRMRSPLYEGASGTVAPDVSGNDAILRALMSQSQQIDPDQANRRAKELARMLLGQ